jgi:hypothetical protein
MKIKTIGQIGLIVVLTTILTTFKVQAQDQPTLPKVKEFGIGLTGFNSFSLQYRWGNEHRLFRLSGNIGGTTSAGNSSDNSSTVQDTINNGSSSTTKTTTPINLNCGLSFSILKIKQVSEKFGFICGGIYAFTYSINQSTTTTNSANNGNYPYNIYTTTSTTKRNSQNFQPSLGIVIGAVYKINSSFLLYAEIAPNIYYAYNKITSNMTSIRTYTNNNMNETTDSSMPSSTNTFGLSNLSNSGATLTIVYRITK